VFAPRKEPALVTSCRLSWRRAFHFSFHVAVGHAGPDADAALGGAGFVARDRAPARAACRDDLQAHAGTGRVREGLERGRVARVTCEVHLLGRGQVPQARAAMPSVAASGAPVRYATIMLRNHSRDPLNLQP